MLGLKQFSREDVMFIAGETDALYQHVGLLMTLDAQDCQGFSFASFYEHCATRIEMIPQFHWKLHAVPMGLDRPYWVEDEHFSYDHHIKRVALPAPGDHATLCEIAANLYSSHLDRSKPLWEIWLIEGLEGGRYAFLQKFHHCMMDGEGAFKVMEFICDFEANPGPHKPVDDSIASAHAGKVPSYPERSSRALAHLASLPREAARGAYDFLRPRVLEQFVWPRKPREQRPPVPSAMINGQITSERGFITASVSLDELKLVKTRLGVSLNDVVLSLVSSAVREYLLGKSALPDEPLRTNIPVSLRTSGDDQMSNKVTNTTVTLATHLDDPLERLREINRESEQAKSKAHEGETGMVELFQMMPPILISTLMESLPADQAPQMMGANLIVSNVRGSPLQMYLAGAQVEGMYPMSILVAGLGLNITCVSYCDRMDFGIMVDPDLLADHEVLGSGLVKALRDYLALCQPAPKRTTTRAAGKSGKKPRRKTAGAAKKPAARSRRARPKSRSRKAGD